MTDRTAMYSFILMISIVALIGSAVAARAMWGHYRAVLHEFEPAPASARLAHPEQTGIDGLTAVSFRSHSGNRIAGWYVPSRNRAAVIVTHGTNTDRSSMLDEIHFLAAGGFGVLAFDWPGDGESEGEIRWGSSERDALTAAIDWVSQRSDVDADKLGAYGFSMGGYLTAQVAATDPRLQAVVLASAPASFLAYTRWLHRQHGWFSSLPAEFAIRRVGMAKEADPPIDRIAAIAPRAVLVLGGSEDHSIPLAMTRELFERAAEPKQLWIVDGASHGHYFRAAPTLYPERIVGFFATHLTRPGNRVATEGKLHDEDEQGRCRNKAQVSCVGVPATTLVGSQTVSSYKQAGSS